MEEFTTNDLTLAAYLEHEGHTIQDVEVIDRILHWFFLQTEALVECVNRYQKGAVSVEPRKFSNIRDRLRKEMLDTLHGRDNR